MLERFSRAELLLGGEAMERLARSRVAVFGVGGVGGYVCEALARSGVGHLELMDNDRVSMSNINRQIIATQRTLGQCKVDVMAERIHDIHPQAEVQVYRRFLLPENAGDFDFDRYDYMVDAVDTVAAKLLLAETAYVRGIPLISCLGAGNKLDPCRFRVSDIAETRVDPLARVMRRELKRRGIPSLKVVWSDEPPLTPLREGNETAEETGRDAVRRAVPGSVAFVPSVAGLIIAGEVVRGLTADVRGISPDK